MNQAIAALLGRELKMGPPEKDRDELLEMLAFDYSVARRWENNTEITVTELARRLVESHPSYGRKAEAESIVRDLERKFSDHAAELLAAHSYDGSEDFDALFAPLRTALQALEAAGVAIDWSVLPPGARPGR